MNFDLELNKDQVIQGVISKIERNLEMPVILQSIENSGHNDRIVDLMGALFDHELGFIKHSSLISEKRSNQHRS